MIHGVIDPTLILRIKILFQLVSTQSQLITTSIRFQGSTILRLWNPRSNDSSRIRTNLERLTPHNYGTGPISSRSSDDWPFPTAQVLSLRDLLTTGPFLRSQLLLFLPFTRVRLNNIKRGIQIPHKRRFRSKLFRAYGLLLPNARALLMLVTQIGIVFHNPCTWNYCPPHLSSR